MFLGSTGLATAQAPPPGVGTITGTASSLVDQTIVDGVVIDQTLEPIGDGRIAIPELGIDMPLGADASFDLPDLPASADPDNPTEVTVVFTAPGLGSFTYLHLRIGEGYHPILTPVLIDTPRIDDHSLARRPDVLGESQASLSPPGVSVDGTDSPSPASAQVCETSGEILVLPKTIRVWENGVGEDELVHTYDFKFYVKHVLPREWFATWDEDSLWAGAMAVKSFAWWHATHSHKHITGPECYDVDSGTNHQVFDPNDSDTRTDAAVDSTWDFYMIEGSGLGADVVQAFHKAGNDPEICGEWFGDPALGDDMSQEGSQACAEDGIPWFFILTTYYFPPEVSWALLHEAGESDSDGCTNGQEVGNNELSGGRRSPRYFWDYYDVWTNTTSGWVKDKAITVIDILGVAGRFGPGTSQSKAAAQAAALTPPTNETGYHAAFDRGPTVGPNHWDRAPADGAISIPDDILGVAGQFGHNCF